MKIPTTIVCDNLDDVRGLSQDIAKLINPTSTVLLHGNLGAGKTTFSQFLIKYLATKPLKTVNSPTFPIIIPYDIKTIDGTICTLHHIDLYRITSEDELLNIGIPDVLDSSVCIIEWPEYLFSYTPKHSLKVNITMLKSNSRQFEISYE